MCMAARLLLQATECTVRCQGTISHAEMQMLEALAVLQGKTEGALQELRSSLALISMAAMQQPHLVADHLPLLLKVRHDSGWPYST